MYTFQKSNFFNHSHDVEIRTTGFTVLSDDEINKLREQEEEEIDNDTEEEIDNDEEESLIGEGEINKLLVNYFPSPGDGYTWLPKGYYKLEGDEAWYPIRRTAKIEDGKIISMEVYWAPATVGTQVMFDKQVRRKID